MRSTYKKPNRKAPRFRNKVKRALDQDFFVKLTKMYPDLTISRQDVRKILNTFHAIAIQVIAETRDGFEFHEQLGNIIVGKFKTQEIWKGNVPESIKYETKIDYLNWEQNEWICKIFYSNFASKYRFRNAALWAFEPARSMKKSVSKAFVKDPYKYVFADHYNRINQVFRLAKKRLNDKLKEQNNESTPI